MVFPSSDIPTVSRSNDHVVRVRLNTYQQGRMLAEKAARLKHTKWATIGPNYEYGLVAAFLGLKVETPIGPISYRASDGQSTMGAWVGTTKVDARRGVGVMVNHEYIPGDKVLPSDDEVKKLRGGS